MKNLFSYPILILLALFLGLAPLYPQPHLVEKLGMLVEGALKRPIDIFDLVWHTWPIVLLIVRFAMDAKRAQ